MQLNNADTKVSDLVSLDKEANTDAYKIRPKNATRKEWQNYGE